MGPETRGRAIEEMRLALDMFEIEGIGHNLPFLSAVMDHPRFVSGEMTTAFIAEEYPGRLPGCAPRRMRTRALSRPAAACAQLVPRGAPRVSGAMARPRAGARGRVGRDDGTRRFDVTVEPMPGLATVTMTVGR